MSHETVAGVAADDGVDVGASVGAGMSVGVGARLGTCVAAKVGGAVGLGVYAREGTGARVDGDPPPQAVTSNPRAKTVAKQVSRFTAPAPLFRSLI